MKITTTIDGNNLKIYHDGKLDFNEALSWYRDYALDLEFGHKLATKDYLRYASAMGWR